MTRTKKKAIFGEEESLLELFEEYTAYVERTHLTMRQMNSRLIRKGLEFSKELPMYRAAPVEQGRERKTEVAQKFSGLKAPPAMEASSTGSTTTERMDSCST